MTSFVRALTQFTQKEIDHLWQQAHPALKHGGFLLLKTPKSGTTGRILIVVPRKVGSAPQRNKIRRQVKSLFYEHKLYTKDYDWIFFAKPPVTELPFQELQKLLLSVM
jgi:ribonuclease P protein component